MATNNKKEKVFPKIPSIVNDSPEVAAAISKLNSFANEEPTTKEKRVISGAPDIAGSTREKLTNNENIAQLFPDVELSIQILTSSILAPNDMMSTAIGIIAPEVNIPSDTKSYIINAIKTHLEKNNNLNDKVDTILREALFTKGAYVEAVIPEASLDEIINPDVYGDTNGEVSLESYVSNISAMSKTKYLGDDEKNDKINLSVEDFYSKYSDTLDIVRPTADAKLDIGNIDTLVNITDNIGVLAGAEVIMNIINDKLSTEGLNT